MAAVYDQEQQLVIDIGRDDAEQLFALLGARPHTELWSDRVYIALADALGIVVPAWMRSTREPA
jgi:hypothetical protein